MTSTFPFPTERHRDEIAPSAVHPTDFLSVSDPASDPANDVAAGKRWRKVDNVSNPTWFEIYVRNEANTAWIAEGPGWVIASYAEGEIPVADENGRLAPGLAGSESGGAINGVGTTGTIAKFTGPTDIGDSALDENTSDITSTKALILPASTTSIASLRAPHGSAPSSPVNGDIWTTTAGIFVRVNGVTVGPLSTGGGGGWTQDVDEDGTTFANFTSLSGSWSSDGTVIKQVTVSASYKIARVTAKQVVAPGYVFEAEVKMVSGSSGLRTIGLIIGTDSTGAEDAAIATLRFSAGEVKQIFIERFGVDSPLQLTQDWGAEDAFIPVRLVASGGYASLFVSGTLVGSANLGAVGDGSYIALANFNCEAHYRNIAGYRMTLPGE